MLQRVVREYLGVWATYLGLTLVATVGGAAAKWRDG